MKRRLFYTARRIVLPEGPVHSIEEPQGFHSTMGQETPAGMKRLEATNVHLGEVHGGLTFDNPLGQGLAHSPRCLNANGIETRRHEQARQGGRFSENEIVIRGKTFRPAEELPQFDIVQERQPTIGLLE